ncbi:hypothetical protein [Alkalicoccus halolimnae]|uniref:Uncharacterized protein n=1 Tax=Alkalicoccus halolimnae TaxID=1667239 RepID=A0A5C7F3I8_9BACI|nr:hypothetical protein [Alkalicoccus halolimnae]TXF85192.1 hypothetical protein FTX54_10270 [Alkalicoccus halolimnae]
MVPRLFLTFVIAAFLSGCTPEEKEIHGRYMFTSAIDNTFQLFVEDSYTGESYRYLNGLHINLPEDYYAESYIIQVNENTLFEDKETGEIITLEESSFPFHWPNQQISIETEEPFTKKTTSMDTPVTVNNRLLPIYSAEKIITYPYSYEDFVEVHTPVEDNHYMLFLFDENFDRQYLYILQTFAEKIEDRYDTYLDVHYHTPEYFQKYLNVESEPLYVLLHTNGEVLRTSDWEKIHRYISDDSGVVLPRAGDPAWLEMLQEY